MYIHKLYISVAVGFYAHTFVHVCLFIPNHEWRTIEKSSNFHKYLLLRRESTLDLGTCRNLALSSSSCRGRWGHHQNCRMVENHTTFERGGGEGEREAQHLNYFVEFEIVLCLQLKLGICTFCTCIHNNIVVTEYTLHGCTVCLL